MECSDMVIYFLEERRGKEIKLLVEAGKFQPVRGKLLDFNDSAIIIEEEDGMQHLFDIDYVISVADAEEWGEDEDDEDEDDEDEDDEDKDDEDEDKDKKDSEA